MSLHLAGQVVGIFGTGDSQPADLIRTLGAHVIASKPADLATYSGAAGGGRHLDVAVVDVRDSDHLPEGAASFKRRHPETPVVLLCATLEPALMLEAMRAGISECVTEPLTAEGLVAAFARVVAQRSPETGDLFVFMGAKGGIGTTTIAVNVATALAKTRHRTLYLDLHLAYGDAAIFLGVEPRFSVVDALENIHRVDESFFKTLVTPTETGVDLLASANQAPMWAVDAQKVRRLLEFARQQYRFVVVDCPRSDATALDALEGATRIILIANQELATLRSGSRIAAALRQRYRADRVMVVANRFDASAEIGHTDVERVIGSAVRHVVPSDYRTSLEALNKGKPLILKNHTRVATSLDALARELGGIDAPTSPTNKSGGLLGRLTGRR